MFTGNHGEHTIWEPSVQQQVLTWKLINPNCHPAWKGQHPLPTGQGDFQPGLLHDPEIPARTGGIGFEGGCGVGDGDPGAVEG